ncbi:MAG: FixH family protein [Gammaproteobacteria bacterium]|nr:FixH family protein [Gammaproteobacteria bacterium]
MSSMSNIIGWSTEWRKRYSQDNPQALRNPWVIGWLGVVVLFLTVNAVFIVLSIVTSPGLVVEDYYEQGRQFEDNASKLFAARNALQWQTKLEIPEYIRVNTPDIYRFSAVDLRGLPIKNAEVNLVAYRPSNAGADFTTALYQYAPGLYQASIHFPLPGIWDLNIHVQREADNYQQTHRISVSAP